MSMPMGGTDMGGTDQPRWERQLVIEHILAQLCAGHAADHTVRAPAPPSRPTAPLPNHLATSTQIQLR